MKTGPILIAVGLGMLLLYAANDLPKWASADSPANSAKLSQGAIKNIYDQTHVPNMVTAVLADYRAYDTLFETVVVFTAGLAIFTILCTGVFKETLEKIPALDRVTSLPDVDELVRISCRLLVPMIQLFSWYVLAHGHHSPGGGFQGGVILAASFILIELSTDLREEGLKYSNRFAIWAGIAGVVVFCGWGALCIPFGGVMLDYSVLAVIIPDVAEMARSHSMLIVELGVMLTVSSMMVLIFRMLSTGGYSTTPQKAP